VNGSSEKAWKRPDLGYGPKGKNTDEAKALIQYYTFTESQGLNVNDDVKATIDRATDGSRPTPRSETAYSGNGSLSKFMRPDLDNAPPLEKPKSTEPATQG
jgi:hypothetical protein